MSAYQECMAVAMRGYPKGISREERGKLFCIDAKVCSGKFTDRKEAQKNCEANPPQPKAAKGRTRRTRGPNCGQDMATLAGCAVQKLDLSGINKESFVEDMALALALALQECGCK